MQSEPDRPPALRVVVVDADDRVRESLAGLLCIGARLEVVGSAGQPGPALDLVLSTGPDLVILDPRLPDIDGGITFIRGVRAAAPGVRVLVLNGSEGGRADLVAVADGCVRKTFRPSDLQAAVIAACASALGPEAHPA